MATQNNPDISQNPTQDNAVKTIPDSEKEQFPKTPEDAKRLKDYAFNEKLYEGDHFEAFNYKIEDMNYTQAYGRLRYIIANFAGLLSRICADMLFIEPIEIKLDDPKAQEYINAVFKENNMNTQLYESQLTASSKGDTIFKMRAAPRQPEDPKDASSLIIEEITPTIFFPQVNQWNVKAEPKTIELAWKFTVGKENYLRKEIHSFRKIENHVYLLKGNLLEKEVDLSILNDPDLKPVEDLLIDEELIFHIPNPKPGNRFFGFSDYKDLVSLFYGLNNRLTKVDNILDKHSDPILALPEGILDENGKVKKSKLGLIEIPEGADANAKPEYIVWNANLESAFTEIEKMVEMLFMVSETSPDILGMGKGQSDSGRALKLKLLRTIAKVRRKRIYYDRAIKEMVYTALEMAKAYNLQCDGLTFNGTPEEPEVLWQDGLPVDELEQAQIEEIRLSAGIQSKKAAIMRIDDLDEDSAAEKVAEIDKETAISMPAMNMGKFPGADPTKLKSVAAAANPPPIVPKPPAIKPPKK